MTAIYPQPQRVAMVDPKTGFITREWLRFFEERFGILSTAATVQAVETAPSSMPIGEVEAQIAGLRAELQSVPFAQPAIIPDGADQYGFLLQRIEELAARISQLEQGYQA